MLENLREVHIITKITKNQEEMNVFAPNVRKRGSAYPAFRAGMTLVELLVAVAIIGIVLSLFMPSLSVARTKMQINRSMHNLRLIGTTIWDYHQNNDGYGAQRTNGGCWGTPPNGNSYWNYWGSMYGGEMDWFHSPLTRETVEKNSDGPRGEGHRYVDYGFNAVASLWYDEVACFEDTKSRRARDIDTYYHPSQTIWAHDHSEPTIEGNGDVPCYAFANDQNALNMSHPDYGTENKEHRANSELALQEIFRNLNHCLILWADGHVSKIPISGQWKPYWYTGGHKGAQQAWEAHENGKFTQPPPYPYRYAQTFRL